MKEKSEVSKNKQTKTREILQHVIPAANIKIWYNSSLLIKSQTSSGVKSKWKDVSEWFLTHLKWNFSRTRKRTNKLMNKCKWILICTYVTQVMLVWWQEVSGCRALLHCLCTVEQSTPAASRRHYYIAISDICNQSALKAQFNVLFCVCIVRLKAPLYSGRRRVLCWTVHRASQTDRFVCMQNTRSHHLGSSWASELNMKAQTHSTTPRWTNRSIWH